MQLLRMRQKPVTPPPAVLRQRLKSRGITQQSLSVAIGASQSQVSRVLSGHSNIRSKLLAKISLYVETLECGVSLERVRSHPDLIHALAEVWDGTEDHALALSTVIRSLSLLDPRLSTTRGARDDHSEHPER